MELVKFIQEHQLWDDLRELKRNEYLKVQGSTDTNIYFVVEGSLRIFLVDEFEEHTIRFAYKNNITVALDSFITDKPSDFYIQALRKTTLKVFKKENFMRLIESNSILKEEWIKLMQELILQLMERERDLLINSPVERYKRVLERSPQVFQEIPNKYIADYLRMTPETLSRIMNS